MTRVKVLAKVAKVVEEVPDGCFRALPWRAALLREERVLWVSDPFAEAVGAAPAELVGRSVVDLVRAEDVARVRRCLARAGEAPARVRFHVRVAQEETRAFDALVSTGPDGTQWMGLEEAAHAAHAEDTISRLGDLYTGGDARALLDRDAFFEASHGLFHSLGWTIALWHVHGDEVELERILGWLPDDAAGAFLGSFVGRRMPLATFPDMVACVRTRRASFIDEAGDHVAAASRSFGWDEAGAQDIAETMHRLGWHRRVCAPVVVGDRVSDLVLGIGHAFTERDFAAVQLFAAQWGASEVVREISADMARQQRLAGLGQLSTMVAHEVRNPLAIIFQACRQIRRRVESEGPVAPLLDILDEEAGRLKRLVDDLVQFAGPSHARLQAVDLTEVLRWCNLGFQQGEDTPVGRGRFRARIPEDASLVRADPLMLRQALTHLLSHAFDRAGPEGHAWLEAQRDGADVRIRVCDDGPPMTAEVAGRVFEPFFTPSASGSGLGLAAVRRLVENQQGRVMVEPQAPDGCVFTITIAAAEPETDHG